MICCKFNFTKQKLASKYYESCCYSWLCLVLCGLLKQSSTSRISLDLILYTSASRSSCSEERRVGYNPKLQQFILDSWLLIWKFRRKLYTTCTPVQLQFNRTFPRETKTINMNHIYFYADNLSTSLSP